MRIFIQKAYTCGASGLIASRMLVERIKTVVVRVDHNRAALAQVDKFLPPISDLKPQNVD